VGGLIVGFTRPAIVEFSFLLAVPTMLAATGYDPLKNASSFAQDEVVNLAAGFVASFVVALIIIKWLLSLVQTRTFIPFGVYRVLVAAGLGLLWYASSV
jgi:undecaprenyl-diphosphatase